MEGGHPLVALPGEVNKITGVADGSHCGFYEGRHTCFAGNPGQSPMAAAISNFRCFLLE
jgi:hypothetical protein